MNTRIKILTAMLLCVSASVSVASPLKERGIYDTVEMPHGELGRAVVKVNVKVPEGITPNNIVAFCIGDQYARKESRLDQDVYFQLNEGQYYFCINGIGPYGEDCLLVTPDVDITEDVELEYDFGDCVNRLESKTLLPDGSEALSELYDTNGNVVESGNVGDYIKNLYVFRKGRLILVHGKDTPTVRRTIYDDGRILSNCVALTNGLNDEYESVVEEYFEEKTTGRPHQVLHHVNGTDVRGEVVLHNNPEDYVELGADCVAPPEGPYDALDGESYWFARKHINEDFWDYSGSGRGFWGKNAKHVMYCSGVCSKDFIKNVVNFGSVFEDNGGAGAYREPYPLVSPLALIEGTKAIFMPSHASDFMEYMHINIPDGGNSGILERPFTYHPRFTWWWNYSSGEYPRFGNSTPSMTVMMLWNERYLGSSSEIYHLGRLGENRACDEPLTWITVERNGENVMYGNQFEFQAWCTQEFTKPRPSGNYVFTIENDNVLVDGMQGLNTTVVKVNASLDDHEPPSLTMLNFRDENDNITDRFKIPGEGTLEFSAVDFHSDINSNNMPYLTGWPLEKLKVEYSPMGEDSFTELAVEEVPEYYFMPEFGYFYRGSLSPVTMASANGWFKLRVTMEDGAGNSQVQTIEPAFRIESAMAGIGSVSDNSDIIVADGEVTASGEIWLYDSSGCLVGRGEGRLSTSGLKGVYVVMTESSRIKVVF